MRDLGFETDGAALHRSAALAVSDVLDALAASVPADRAGVRLNNHPGMAALVVAGSTIGQIAVAYLGMNARPVRAVLFDKTASTNWALGWHQDRTIVVRERREVPGFGPWTRKAGLQHVEPPFEIIADMVTLRVHLDVVPADNAPLLIAPGSHRLGRVAEVDVVPIVTRLGVATCLAERGDVWAYSTPILHASAAGAGTRRRVLQVDYAWGDLPGGLNWLGV